MTQTTPQSIFTLNSNIIIVGIGDIKLGKSPGVIRTTLGSCIAVCLYDTATKSGGMLHCMMANAPTESTTPIKRAKYADTGVIDLLADIKKQFNLSKESLTAKIFGGAKILKMVTQDIGKGNEEAVRKALKELNIKITAAKTGGEKGYQVDFDLNTGKVYCRVFGNEQEEF